MTYRSAHHSSANSKTTALKITRGRIQSRGWHSSGRFMVLENYEALARSEHCAPALQQLPEDPSSRGADKAPDQRPSEQGISRPMSARCGGALVQGHAVRPRDSIQSSCSGVESRHAERTSQPLHGGSPKGGHLDSSLLVSEAGTRKREGGIPDESWQAGVAPGLHDSISCGRPATHTNTGRPLLSTHRGSAWRVDLGNHDAGSVSRPLRPVERRVQLVSEGLASCTAMYRRGPDRQLFQTARLPQKFRQTAHLPLTMKTGSLKPPRASTNTSRARSFTRSRHSAMSGFASDTRQGTSSRQLIFSVRCYAASMAGNGSARRWLVVRSNGGLISSAPPKSVAMSSLESNANREAAHVAA